MSKELHRLLQPPHFACEAGGEAEGCPECREIGEVVRRLEREAGSSWREQVRLIHETVVKKWEPYSDEDTRFVALALAGEVGELCNLVKKEWRGNPVDNPKRLRREMADELADIRIYLELLALCLGVDLDVAVAQKIPELLRRWPEAREAIAALHRPGDGK